jgi:hypothetical protein
MTHHLLGLFDQAAPFHVLQAMFSRAALPQHCTKSPCTAYVCFHAPALPCSCQSDMRDVLPLLQAPSPVVA